MNIRCVGYLTVMMLAVSVPAAAHADELPDWIRSLFMFYADGHISDADLLNAIEYLASTGIITLPDQYQEDAPSDSGDFLVRYDTPTEWQEYEELIMQEQYFEDQASWLNENFMLPHDVHILITAYPYNPECHTPNAFYVPSLKQIEMCYELFEKTYDNFQGWTTYDSPEEAMWNVIDHTFYHELGHALIDVYELPYTGLEENVADQFANYVMIELTPDIGHEILHSVVIDYLVAHEQDGQYDPLQYHDTHQLNKQRAYTIACFVYGSDHEMHHWLYDSEYLPADRAKYCMEEYDHAVRAWEMLLDPHRIE